MAQIFISYSRVDKTFTRAFVTALREMFTAHVIWFDEELTGGDDWWKEILRQIDQSAIFIYLLSNESVQSAYCQAEFAEAQRLRKRIITVQVRDRTDVPENLNNIQYVDMKDGMDDAGAQRKLVRAINKYVQNLSARKPRPLSPTPTPKPDVKKESERPPHQEQTQTPDLNIISDAGSTTQTQPVQTQTSVNPSSPSAWMSSVLLGMVLVLLVVVGIFFVSPLINPAQTLTLTQTSPSVAVLDSPTPTVSPTDSTSLSPSQTPTVTLSPSATLEPEAAARATIDTANTQTVEANILFQTEEAQKFAPTWTAAVEQTGTMAMVQSAITYQESVNVALTAIALTATFTFTPTTTPNATQTLEAFAVAGITANADWTPVERDFGGVTMVYVPTGCFMMGSTDGDRDEQPVEQVCITEPFWLDKTEVTQAQFREKSGVKGDANYFTGENRPVESITWTEAQEYCEKRGGRLPTEAEWEFAARGPDGLKYPWGEEFIPENVVYSGNSGRRTADVGIDIRLAGASWLGALDLSGNVWEWTSSLSFHYPYIYEDGREDMTALSNRVIRGGSWYDVDAGILRATDRSYDVQLAYNVGFRCARSSITE